MIDHPVQILIIIPKKEPDPWNCGTIKVNVKTALADITFKNKSHDSENIKHVLSCHDVTAKARVSSIVHTPT